jgi:tetratricopeptide (TPR) repeat protein
MRGILRLLPSKESHRETIEKIQRVSRAKTCGDGRLRELVKRMFYYSISNYTAARALTEEIVQRTSPPAPWWALNRYGMCQLALGLSESALAAFECALPVVPTREDEGTTLVNLSQIYHVRGDYDRALGYLEQSLAICREIGDKAGEGTALSSLDQIYYVRGDYDRALGYLEQSLAIRREIGHKVGLVATLHTMGHIARQADNLERAMTLWSEAFSIAMETQHAQGIFETARTLGQVFASAGASAQARQLLQLAVEVGQAAGFPGVQEVEAVLHRLPAAET